MPDSRSRDSSPRRPSGPRWRRRSEARPSEIVEAALALFVERGFAATRMEEIAKRAGVTKGTVYLYFPSKEDLFRAVVNDAIGPSMELGERLVEEHVGSTSELFGKLIRAWWRMNGVRRLGCMAKLIIGEAANFPELARYYVDTVILRGRRIFASAIERGIASGEFREVDVPTAVRLAIAPLLNLASHQPALTRYDSDPLDEDRYLDLHIEIFLRGISAHPEDADG